MAAVTLVILDNPALINILKRRPDIVREFSFLAAVASKVKTLKTGCTACKKKKATAMAAVEEARKKLANLPADRKNKFKTMLQAQNIRIFYQNGANQTVKVTI